MQTDESNIMDRLCLRMTDTELNHFLHKQQGEPITDSEITNWDLNNGVMDGTDP